LLGPHLKEKQIASGIGSRGTVEDEKKGQINKQYETKKNTHLRRVLGRSSYILFQALSAPRSALLFSATKDAPSYSSNSSTSTGRIHRSRRRIRGP